MDSVSKKKMKNDKQDQKTLLRKDSCASFSLRNLFPLLVMSQPVLFLFYTSIQKGKTENR